jgi:hypothetical protein
MTRVIAAAAERLIMLPYSATDLIRSNGARIARDVQRDAGEDTTPNASDSRRGRASRLNVLRLLGAGRGA